MTVEYAVIGSPIAHSLSPTIHNAIFQHEGRDARMVALDPGSADELEGLLDTWLTEKTYAGLAVTAPYKPLIAHVDGQLSEAVLMLDVANTLTLRAGSLGETADDGTGSDAHWRIDNTDVAGFISAIEQLISPLQYRTFMVFGTGATARTIIYALIKQGAATIQVVGRSREKVEACLSIFDDTGCSEVVATTVPPGKHFDCAIDATSLGLSAQDNLVFPISWFEEYAATVFDVVYRPQSSTPLIKECRDRKIPAMDGREMLYAQAVAQAKLWGATSDPEELMGVVCDACEQELA